jgi:hypothetical protein
LRAQLARKVTAGLALALLPLTACSAEPPSQEALANKLKAENILKTLSAQQLSCIAGVLLKYERAGDLKDYVDGKKSLEAIRGPKDKQDELEREWAACATTK